MVDLTMLFTHWYAGRSQVLGPIAATHGSNTCCPGSPVALSQSGVRTVTVGHVRDGTAPTYSHSIL